MSSLPEAGECEVYENRHRMPHRGPGGGWKAIEVRSHRYRDREAEPPALPPMRDPPPPPPERLAPPECPDDRGADMRGALLRVPALLPELEREAELR